MVAPVPPPPPGPKKKGPGKPAPIKAPTKSPQIGPPPPAAKANLAPVRSMSVSTGVRDAAQKIVVYGPGGVGKTKLASLVSEIEFKPIFIDLEDGTNFLDVARIDPAPENFEELLAAVRFAVSDESCDVIVVDSLTKAEELAIAYTIRTRPHEKGHWVDSVEGYGFGKGYMHVFETFLLFLQELDGAARAGKHVVGICHDCTASVPNPGGEDWIRYEPRLQSPPSGRGSIRHRVKEWCDHLFYVGFDVFVSKDGKAQGSGTRTIYPAERPTHWAKSRSLSDPVVYEDGSAYVWQLVFGSEE